MLYQFSRKLHNSRSLITLLLCVFVICWGSNAKVWKSLFNTNTVVTSVYSTDKLVVADTPQSSSTIQAEEAQLNKNKSCDKGSYLLQQAQPDLSAMVAVLFIALLLLVSVFRTQKPLELKPFWLPKRRTHSIFCCFLE